MATLESTFVFLLAINSVCCFTQTTIRRLGEPMHPMTYTVLPRDGISPPKYAQFPETFPDHHILPGLQYHQQPGYRPPNLGAGQVPPHIPYAFRPVGSKPDQVMDHHFLTRPQSIITTPTGPRYMPHLLEPRPPPTNFHMERPLYMHKPAFEAPKPGVTVIAKNIFIHNDMHGSRLPFEPFHFGEKFGQFSKPISSFLTPEVLDKKLSLLGILPPHKPEELFFENKVEAINTEALDKPTNIIPFSSIKGQYLKPSVFPNKSMNTFVPITATFQKPMTENMPYVALSKPHSTDDAHGNSETFFEKMQTDNEMPEPRFHPLLTPFHEAVEKLEKLDAKDGNTDSETTMITVTGLGNVAVETERTGNVKDDTEKTESEKEN